jgi:hypothetical protein
MAFGTDEFERTLAHTACIQAFICAVSDLLSSYELNAWFYRRLDLPVKLSVKTLIGTLDEKYRTNYFDKHHYKNDFLADTAITNGTSLQSEIESTIRNTYLKTDKIIRYNELIKLNKRYGYADALCVKNASIHKQGEFLFGVTSKKRLTTPPFDLPNLVKQISTTIDRVGTKKYASNFTLHKAIFDAIATSTGIKVLESMGKRSLSIRAASEHFAISESKINESLTHVLRLLDADTLLGGYVKAVNRELIK